MNITPSAKKAIITMAAIAVAAILAIIAFNFFGNSGDKSQDNAERDSLQAQNEQLKLENEQLQLEKEYSELNQQFLAYENQAQYLKNDSILHKYDEAKNRVEQLLAQLNSEKAKNQRSQARIAELEKEIATLKEILRDYLEQINALGQENESLKQENSALSDANRQLTDQVADVSKQNEHLNQRMTLAEKLNVTGVSLTPLKGNGKEEKKITKAKQLQVRFTIPQNNSTPVGEKRLYLRITGPEGSLLGQRGTFRFEGANVGYTESKVIEYSGQEISGITVYYNATSTTLNPGQYTVEIFADNYRLASKHFTFEK